MARGHTRRVGGSAMADAALVDTLNADVKAMSEAIVSWGLSLRSAAGTTPVGQEKLSPEEIAQRWMPSWFVEGNAYPPISTQYWQNLRQTVAQKRPNTADKEVADFDLKMRSLYANPKYALAATIYRPPDLHA